MGAEQVQAYQQDRQDERDRACWTVKIFRRAVKGLPQLLGAIALVGLGGLFAAIDAAISTVSLARVQELVREARPVRWPCPR
ncbi:hypothetical protein I551_5904 [Mycobacterium ulcerans str. Harvey]|uniref:Uncharacterized protein n=1 Tax=Mycobacterium ulcerans str. Harvey TaxID=1299332 RepID=A0ABN0QSH4_MYCUL|nr:hypothetical protein I551_5904 [Mycobacterium ulcerans str. Harvey]